MTTKRDAAIAEEWKDHCQKYADVWMSEIAQASRTAAKIVRAEMIKKHGVDDAGEISVHIGQVSAEFIHKVAFFLPDRYSLEYTDPKRGWNNYLIVKRSKTV